MSSLVLGRRQRRFLALFAAAACASALAAAALAVIFVASSPIVVSASVSPFATCTADNVAGQSGTATIAASSCGTGAPAEDNPPSVSARAVIFDFNGTLSHDEPILC
jgi:hypothetical protein